MRFANPEILNFLWLVPLLFILLRAWAGGRRKLLLKVADLSLIERLTASVSYKKRLAKQILFVLSIFFLIVALARPQFGEKNIKLKRLGIDVAILLDTSLSMLAEDIKPNRLEKAKFEIQLLIEKLEGDRISIAVFSGSPMVICPPTLDYEAAAMFLDVINADMAPTPGTMMGLAIDSATRLFDPKEKKYKVVILISDGEDQGSDPIGAARRAYRQGVRIFTIGIGSKEGEPIPLKDEKGRTTGYKKDKSGAVVLTKLGIDTLMGIAGAAGGAYYTASQGEWGLDKIYSAMQKLEKKELREEFGHQYEDRFQYPLGLALILLIVEALIPERRKVK
ncbi:MAG: VWA domain-containing protein [Candidatus Omnitrophica bacterium]|nr:VWA domain-containing protein [Candidatus Omnitrophota bacterium]